MNDPPDELQCSLTQTCLSPTGITEPEVLLEQLRVLARAGVGVEEDDALLLGPLESCGETTSDSYCAATPETSRCFSASGIPSRSYVDLMSSGRSSQLAACFSVDRTKYLMLSKSMPDRSAPQVGIGFLPNRRNPLSRRSSIHSGSVFLPEMSRTGLVEAALLHRRRRVGPAVLVPAETLQLGVGGGTHRVLPSTPEGAVVFAGRAGGETCVVQIPSPREASSCRTAGQE